MYKELGTKQSERIMYRITKSSNKKSTDVEGSKVIKVQANKLRFQNKKVRDGWRKYFET